MKHPSGDPPLGIAYIASYLRENVKDVKVKIVDTTFNDSWTFVESSLKRERPDVVGVHAMTPMIKDAYKVAEIAKSCGAKLVVFGGPHPSVFPESVFKECRHVDAIVIGEADFSFAQIIKKFGRSKNLKNLLQIPNLVVRVEGGIEKSKERFFIKNLDDLPFPAWDLLDMKQYIEGWFQMDAVSSKLRGTNIIASRYCPYNCSFCQPIPKIMFGNFLRKRSLESIISELIELKKIYNLNSFYFTDDMLLMSKQEMGRFCELLEENKLNLLWGFNTRVDQFGIGDIPLLKKMYEHGLRSVCIGIESGSQRILTDIYNKGITLKQVRKAVYIFKKCKLKVRGFFIVGAPTETGKEILKTIIFSSRLKLDEAPFSILCPMPGTRLYDMLKEKGWKIREDWELMDYYSRSVFISDTLGEKELRLYQRLALILFYLHPYRWKYLLNSFISPRRTWLKLKNYFI